MSGIWTVTAGEFPSNAYICDISGGECILIDPGLDGETIDKKISELALKPKYVFCTHGHFDHFGSASLFQQKYSIPVFVHEKDHKLMKTANFMLMLIKIKQKVQQPEVSWINDDNLAIDINGKNLQYIPIAGHTQGSCLIEFGNAIFSGDSMYARGVGLSNLPGEDHSQLKNSILSLWDKLPEERIIYPGHGKSASFGEIKRENKKLLEFLGV